jgi:hypothetical protein
MRALILSITCVFALGAPRAEAQADGARQKGEPLASRWTAVFSQVLAERGLTLVDAAGAPAARGASAARVRGDAETVRAAYAETVRRLIVDPQLGTFFKVDPTLIDEKSERSDQDWVARLAAEVSREKGAKSASATLTNPAAPPGTERSGFTDLVSLALDAQNFVAADKSAVTVSFNALALVGLNDETRSAQALYRDHDALRRLGGSFTFGAKVPENAITGLSGLPSAETLLDAIGWDVKYRVYGDRDPRAVRWYGLMVGYMGGLTEIAANLIAAAPSDDRDVVKDVLNDTVGVSLRSVKTHLEDSAQVTVKTGGQHLTNEKGKNRYTFALLADKGFGATDLTANASYAIVDDVTIVPGSVSTLKTWSGAAGVKHLVAKDLLVAERAIELSLDARFEIPVGAADLPVERKNVWHVVGAVSLPWGDAVSIPVSITYSSDPNSLTKEKFVTGYIGISYDFGALKSLFKPKEVKP